jgi:opacity protein-like surface antigen
MLRKAKLALIVLFAAFTLPLLAQSNELGVTAGGYFPINSQVAADNAFTVGGSFAHRLVGVPLASIYLELPVYATFNSTAHLASVTSPSTFGASKYSALFVTPGLKLKLAPEFPVSPYIVAGGGITHFSKTNTASADSNTGTFDIGGGLDFKIAPFLSARGEIRDYYTGNPKIFTNVGNREHQLLATVGLVLRF